MARKATTAKPLDAPVQGQQKAKGARKKSPVKKRKPITESDAATSAPDCIEQQSGPPSVEKVDAADPDIDGSSSRVPASSADDLQVSTSKQGHSSPATKKKKATKRAAAGPDAANSTALDSSPACKKKTSASSAEPNTTLTPNTKRRRQEPKAVPPAQANAEPTEADKASSDQEASQPKAKKPRAKKEVVFVTEREECPRKALPPSAGTQYFKVITWNVNGLKGKINMDAEVLKRIVEREHPDLICLQETKTGEKSLAEFQAADFLPGYASSWSCSTTKKGYAGTAAFYPVQNSPQAPAGGEAPPAKDKPSKQKKLSAFFTAGPKKAGAAADTPADPKGVTAAEGTSDLKVLSVRYGIDDESHEGEGRVITVEYDHFFVVNVYVPNSGQKLERLEYRLNSWDPALRQYVSALEATGKGVIVTGDLNVAHLDIDIYNCGAYHLKKCAGTTPQERAAFSSWLDSGAVKDAFRHVHGDAKAQYTWWSARTNARPENKGLRLDYFICSAGLFASNAPARVHDCFIDHETTVGLSDHCPIGLVLQIREALEAPSS